MGDSLEQVGLNHFGMQPATPFNSAFYASGIAKSTTGLPGWG